MKHLILVFFTLVGLMTQVFYAGDTNLLQNNQQVPARRSARQSEQVHEQIEARINHLKKRMDHKGIDERIKYLEVKFYKKIDSLKETFSHFEGKLYDHLVDMNDLFGHVEELLQGYEVLHGQLVTFKQDFLQKKINPNQETLHAIEQEEKKIIEYLEELRGVRDDLYKSFALFFALLDKLERKYSTFFDHQNENFVWNLTDDVFRILDEKYDLEADKKLIAYKLSAYK